MKVRRVRMVDLMDEGGCHQQLPPNPSNLEWIQPRRFYEPLIEAALAARTNHVSAGTCSPIIEDVVRCWLGSYVPLMRRRGLYFEERPTGVESFQPKVLEIDAVASQSQVPRIFFEFKFTGRWDRVSSARRQLRERLRVARKRWPHVRLCVVVVNREMRSMCSSPLDILQRRMQLNVARMREALIYDYIPTIVLSIRDVWRFSSHVGLRLGDALLERLLQNSVQTKKRCSQARGVPAAA